MKKIAVVSVIFFTSIFLVLFFDGANRLSDFRGLDNKEPIEDNSTELSTNEPQINYSFVENTSQTKTDKPLYNYDLFEKCKESTEELNCWNESKTPCAYIIDLEERKILNDSIFCRDEKGSVCKFGEGEFSCNKNSTNPLHFAVQQSSSLNRQIRKLRYEVFLEPGDFNIKPVGDRFIEHPIGLQIPSYTRLVGSTFEGEQQSRIFVSKEDYDSISGCALPEWSGGECIQELILLTNAVNSNATTLIEKERELKQESLADPVNNVVLKNLHILGVSGLDQRTQQITQARRDLFDLEANWVGKSYIGMYREYCTLDPCYYNYTSLHAIASGRIQGGNVQIVNNKIESVGGSFIMLGYFLNNDLDGDGFIDQLRASGTEQDPIVIKENRCDGSRGPDSVIVEGEHIQISANSVKNGYNDLYGVPNGISVYTDSHYVSVTSNYVSGFTSGINIEGVIPCLVMGEQCEETMKASNRVASNNLVQENIVENVCSGIQIQRQNSSKIYKNEVSIDKNRFVRIANSSSYIDHGWRASKSFGWPVENAETWLRTQNINYLGTGILFRENQNAYVAGNVFEQFPRGVYMEHPDFLARGMKDNSFGIKQTGENSPNTFKLNAENKQLFEKEVSGISIGGQSAENRFGGFYYPPSVLEQNRQSSNNRFCSNNVIEHPARYNGGEEMASDLRDSDCAN
jgi:hypothetical protein